MESGSSTKEAGGGLPGKKVSPQAWPMPGGGFKNIPLKEVFDVLNSKKKYNANQIQLNGVHPYVVRSANNNGIKGYANLDEKNLNEARTISFGQDTATVFYQPEAYFTGDKIKILRFKHGPLTPLLAQYLLATLRASFRHFSWGGSSYSDEVINNILVNVPFNAKGILDKKYMESRIRELEESRIRELEAYLSEAGFENCNLTPSEINALNVISEKTYKGEYFEISKLYHKLKMNNFEFDKRRDTSQTPSEEFCVPLVNAKVGDNGIMYYGRPKIFQSEPYTIDVIQNGAIATGRVYAQPQPTGVLWDAYLIKATSHTDTENTLLFMACAIEKRIRPFFNRDLKATWERIKSMKIFLPVHENKEPDLELMENFINATKKIIIANLKEYLKTEHCAYINVIADKHQ